MTPESVVSSKAGTCEARASLLLRGYGGAGSVHAGGRLSRGCWLGKTEGQRTTLPLDRDGKPGCARVFAAEERAGGIEGNGPSGVVDDRKCGQFAGQSGKPLHARGCCGASTI